MRKVVVMDIKGDEVVIVNSIVVIFHQKQFQFDLEKISKDDHSEIEVVGKFVI